MNGALNRNFSLLGDPSMKLAVPDLGIHITSIKNTDSGNTADTLSAFQKIELQAEVIDPITGGTMSGFNGSYLMELRDKSDKVVTLGDESSPFSFREERNLLFKGEGKIADGKLTATLFMPASTNPELGTGSLRIVGRDALSGFQALGSKRVNIGGTKPNQSEDKTGPTISLKINGQKSNPFVFSSSQVEIQGVLFDLSGINVSGFIPGKELTIQVNDQEPILLNEKFIATTNSYQEGVFTLTVNGLIEGKNRLILRASDNVGNESEQITEVEINGSERITLISHKVYPNPASEKSSFEIKHNRPGDNLILVIEVYSLGGQILFSENDRLVKAEETIQNLSWIFLQNQTKYPAKGTYIYKLTLKSESDQSEDSVSGKLVIQ